MLTWPKTISYEASNKWSAMGEGSIMCMMFLWTWTENTFVIKIKEGGKKKEVLQNSFLWSGTRLKKVLFIKPSIIVKKFYLQKLSYSRRHLMPVQVNRRMFTDFSVLWRRFPKHLASLKLYSSGQVDLILLETRSGLWRMKSDGYWE